MTCNIGMYYINRLVEKCLFIDVTMCYFKEIKIISPSEAALWTSF